MPALPNPFESALEPARVADDGHWPATADPADPVAVTFSESSTARGSQEAPAEATQNPATAGPFDGPDLLLAELIARGFDVDGFLNDIEPLPAFLLNPRPEYLRANEMIPMLAVLAGH